MDRDRLRQRPWLGLTGAGALVAAVGLSLAPAGAETSDGPNATVKAKAKPLHGYASCNAKAWSSDRFCFVGDKPVAVFRSMRRRDVDYKLCFRKEGRRLRCRERTTNNPGQRSRIRFDVDGAGKYRLVWFSGGGAVDRDKLVVRERSVFAIGDSLGQGTKPYLPKALKRWKVDQSVSISRHAPEGVSILRKRGGLPGAVVFALGTNDSPGAVSTFKDALTDALRIIGKTRCLVVPNIVRPPVGGRSYAGYNAVIAKLDRRKKNFREVDWAKLVARNRGWLAADGVHVSATGYAARARAIAKQVERC